MQCLLSQIERGRQAVEQLQRQREGRVAAAAALTEGGREARQHSQQAMRWVIVHVAYQISGVPSAAHLT